MNLFINFWLHWIFFALPGLSLVAASEGYSSFRCMGFSLGGISCCKAQSLDARALVVVRQRLSCSVTCGIFLDQGLNPGPLHWQADSYPPHHHGRPRSLQSIRTYVHRRKFPRMYNKRLTEVSSENKCETGVGYRQKFTLYFIHSHINQIFLLRVEIFASV